MIKKKSVNFYILEALSKGQLSKEEINKYVLQNRKKDGLIYNDNYDFFHNLGGLVLRNLKDKGLIIVRKNIVIPYFNDNRKRNVYFITQKGINELKEVM